MTLILFSFSVDTDTQEAAFSGNVNLRVALQVLQQLVIDEAIKKAKEQKVEEKKETPL